MPPPRGQQRDKPFRDALRMEIAAAGEDFNALRKVAKALLDKAGEGDLMSLGQPIFDGFVRRPGLHDCHCEIGLWRALRERFREGT